MIDFEKLREEGRKEKEWREAHPYPLIWIGSLKGSYRARISGPDVEEYWKESGLRINAPNYEHYVGRRMGGSWMWLEESYLHNPFTVEEFGRQQALAKYKKYLFEALKQDTFQRAELKKILGYALDKEGITLMCWCVHEYADCHAFTIKNAALHYWKTGEYLTW